MHTPRLPAIWQHRCPGKPFRKTHPLPVLLQYGSLPVHGSFPLPESHHLIFSPDKESLYPLPVPDILARIYPLLLPYLITLLLNRLSFLRLPFCRQIRTFSHLLYSPQFHKASAEPAHPTHQSFTGAAYAKPFLICLLIYFQFFIHTLNIA